MWKNKRIGILLTLILSGCAVGPDYKRPNDYLPETFTGTIDGEATASTNVKIGDAQTFIMTCDAPKKWWELFQSQALNDLVAESLLQNPNIDAAKAALNQAMENVYAEEGFLYPTITAGFTPTRQHTSRILSSNLANNAYYYNLYTAQVSVAYTADVFGGIRRQIESLDAQARSAYYDLEATYLTLIANVVNTAIQEAGLRGQIAAIKELISIQSKLLNLFNKLYELGQVALADVVLQEAAMAAVEATLSPLQKQLAIQRDALSVLVGRFPSETFLEEFTIDSFQLPTELPLLLPSKLVENRPDIRAAEELLHSATANIGVAIANRLPNITLGIDTYGAAATNLGHLFKSNTLFWQLAGGILEPVFDGGTLEHQERAARAAYDQAKAQYRVTVLNAFQNVADSLQAIHWDSLGLQSADRAVRASEKSLKIAQARVAAGDINIIEILQVEQVYHQALMQLVLAQTNRLADTVSLFQSLGGNYLEDPVE